MAKLRLFANLREIAGSARVDVGSGTVGGAIEEVSERYGDDFRRTVATSRVWVNGETASYDDPVGANDEMVILPPVSGGNRSMTAPATTLDFMAFLPFAVIAIAVLANLQSQEIWAAALVAIVAAWALDLGSVMSSRGRMFAPLAVVVTSAVSAMAAHVMGGTGYSLALVVAVVVALGWAVAFPPYRQVDVVSPLLLVSLFAGLGTASMILARSAHSPDPRAVDVFLVSVIAGLVLGSIVERMPSVPVVDPFSMTAVGAVLGAVGAAFLWDLDVVGYLLIGLGIAVALVAGRGFASMLRTGKVALTERPPGWLSSVDGAVLAAAIFFPLLAVIL
jgi:molybdopterin converting factor small subunit